ncbi:MAG: UDP-N-acetylglucosamine--N-acetylmuramyl-(pentapeptide) pyrophosphoryl-undecaprenol N-acetylglucosamine transferase [Anaerolineales bacterium]
MYPALAVIAELSEKAEVLWVGGQGGMEAELVKRAGVPFEAIPAAGLHGVGLRSLPVNASRLLQGIPAARRIIRRFRPDVLFFTGGYVGVPVALAGQRLPQAVFVPDIEPALALRLISRFARVINVSTTASERFYSDQKHVVVTGYPTQADFVMRGKAEARRIFGLDESTRTLLIFGGSRGARSINEAVWEILPELLEFAQVVHITGELDWPRVPAVTEILNATYARRYYPHPYLHEGMDQALGAADLVVSRSGAATIGEYPLFGLPAVLVPYPHAWRYQEMNAAYLEDNGGAIVLRDEDLRRDLLPMISELMQDQSRLEEMGAAMRNLSMPGAAKRIAGEIESLAMKRGRDT